ncbi:MAG: redox-regulated ATPase YchF [Gemmatimonadota bacterium]|nr:redox-regulated ATPase YchF [Candidatus Palauibacterales bacterium]
MSSALKAGIVGLPNAGKSTLFNALTASSVPAEGYPFTTIDPNIGVVEVPDPRLDRLFALIRPPHSVPAVEEFVDIAGLVAGAHRGEGLGNRFLSHIREVQALVHVVRCFDDANVAHPSGSVDPTRDVATVETELLLADLETVEKRLDRVERTARSGDRAARAEADLLRRVKCAVEEGRAARDMDFEQADVAPIRHLSLLTQKKVMYVANIGELDLPSGGERVAELRSHVDPSPVVIIASELEAQLRGLPAQERDEYMAAVGLEDSGVDRLLRATYDLLGLVTFFTFNEKEVRAWTLRRGALAPEAAGVVHSDFRDRFIRAETVAFRDLDRVGSLKGVRDEGLIRMEGRDYVVQDGDILLFRTQP